MISVAEALANILSLLPDMPPEQVALSQAGRRVLAEPIVADRDQPPFASSAMDGYAVRSDDLRAGAVLQVVDEAAAGSHATKQVAEGQAIRIFTGAPVPVGADRILIQEDCTRSGDDITVGDNIDASHYIRPSGSDFKSGDRIAAAQLLTPSLVALAAAMNAATLSVSRKPDIALLATGDELVAPGGTPNEDQIMSSNNFGLKAMIEAAGGIARLLPIAKDNQASLETALEMGAASDLIVTLGGASVGDHDLMGQMTQSGQLDTEFYKVAMRPGKPLMAGRYKGTPLVGLPGNPVSALVCGQVFIVPAIRQMLGFAPQSTVQTATLAIDLPANSPREHYMRAKLADGMIQPATRQDSSLLSVLADANVLLIRPPNQSALRAGSSVHYLSLT